MATDPIQTPDVNESVATQKPMPTPPPPAQGFTLLALVGVLGLLLVFLALGYWLITQDFGLPPRLLLGAAGICLALFFWFNPGSLGSIFNTKGIRYGGNTIILIAALIGIVIILNLLAGRFVLAQADLTTNGQYTLADQTEQILQNLNKDISVHAFFTAQNANRSQAEQLLRQYKALSSHFNYEMIDPNQDPLKARSFQISQDGTVIFTFAGVTSCQVASDCQSIYNVSETDFSGAIITMLNPTQHTVYFLTGHGEHSTASATNAQTSSDQTSYSTVSTNLARDRYATQTLDLSGVASIAITGTTSLVIAGPQKPLSDQEIGKINQFLANGGRLMILADPPFENTSGIAAGKATIDSLNKLLAPYGTSLGAGVILDQAAAQAGSDPSVIVVNQYGNSTITNRFNGFNALFPVADAIFTDQPAITDTNVTRTPLILSSSSSGLYSTLTASGQCCDTTQSTPGPLNLAASLDYGASGGSTLPAGRKHTRIVVFGDSDFPVNTLLTGQFVNSDLFVNSINWLNEADQLSGITPKTADTRFMTLTQTDANVVFYSSVLVLPLVVLLIGGAIWWRRR